MWIVLSLFAAACYAVAGMVVKVSITRVMRNQNGLVLFHAVAALIVSVVAWAISSRELITDPREVALGLAAGAFTAIAGVAVFKAFTLDDASTIQILSQTQVPASVALAYLILDEKLTLMQAAGSALILAGVIGASWSAKGFHLRSIATLWLMLFTVSCWALLGIFAKIVLRENDVFAFSLYLAVGYVVVSAAHSLLHPTSRKAFLDNLRPTQKLGYAVILSSEVLYVFALAAQLVAYRDVNPGLVVSVSSVGLFLSILIGLVLTKRFPDVLDERIDRATLVRKFSAGAVVVAGIVVLNLST